MSRSIRHLTDALDAIAPFNLAEEWDNVGLLVGDRQDMLGDRVVLLAIDLTAEVAREAIEHRVGAVIAYHPPIFKPMKRLTPTTPREAGLLAIVRSGAAVLSPHTALDAAPNGLAEWLVRRAGPGGDTHAITPATRAAEHKVVVFVPERDAQAVREAMADAGAGVIGDYTHCSYQLAGSGTFLGGDTTNPAVGERGILEHVEELRIEMVCQKRALPGVLDALVRAHPYEEPAYDVYALAPTPNPRAGAGRVMTLNAPMPIEGVADNLKAALEVEHLKIAHAGDGQVRRVAACPGAGAGLLHDAIAAGADCFITGEMRHHEALAAVDAGCTVILAGHTNTERPYLPTLAARLTEALPDVTFAISNEDAAPFTIR